MRHCFPRLIPFVAAYLLVGTVAADDKPKAEAAQTSPRRQPSAKNQPAAAKPIAKKPAEPELPFPPTLPGGIAKMVVDSDDLLRPPPTLRSEVALARVAPRVEFYYYPEQNYQGNPWSVWGDSSFAEGKYYSAIGDHKAPQGTAFVFEFDPATGAFRKLLDIAATLKMPAGHYVPSKIHSHVELADDGYVYCSTHRGSTRVTTDAYHYAGDWILRTDPRTAQAEVVARGPVPKHCLPNGLTDRRRLIFYGGTAPGSDEDRSGIQFFAYDLKNRKLLYSGPEGPARAMILSSSTGRVYYVPGTGDAPLMRYDAASGRPPQRIDGEIGIRAATDETPQGTVYTVSQGQGGAESQIFAFDVRTERITRLGPAAVGENQYVAAVKADPSGRYLYYAPGAHGGSQKDHSAVVQFDTRTKTRKVLAFLHPAVSDRVGGSCAGTYGLAVDDRGERLFLTWNVLRGGRVWDCCGLTVIHIPPEERPL